jgi:hypothetical protein
VSAAAAQGLRDGHRAFVVTASGQIRMIANQQFCTVHPLVSSFGTHLDSVRGARICQVGARMRVALESPYLATGKVLLANDHLSSASPAR